MADPDRRVPRLLDVGAAWSWRLIVIGVAVYGILLILSTLRLVVIPIAVAFFLATVLVPPARWLRGRGLPSWAAAWISMLTFLAVLSGITLSIVFPLTDQAAELGSSLESAGEDIEDWLVDGPLGIERSTVDDARERLTSTADDAASNGDLVEGAVLAGEIVAGIILAFVIAFFLVKDGPLMQRWASGLLPVRHRARADRIANAAWDTLGRYLLGAASLGLVEGAIIGITLYLVGSEVVLPVVVLTFVAAFFPFVGAIAAGVVAVMVTLATAGVGPAVVVAIVAVLVQQFDNDLLAPVIYGRALRVHPLVVIVAITGGAAAGGLLGAFAAVPVTAIAVNAVVAARTPAPDAPERDGTLDPAGRAEDAAP